MREIERATPRVFVDQALREPRTNHARTMRSHPLHHSTFAPPARIHAQAARGLSPAAVDKPLPSALCCCLFGPLGRAARRW